MKGPKRRLNRLASEDVIAIPLLTATLALVLEYWVVEIAEVVATLLGIFGIDRGAWSLVIFHVILIGVLYMNVVWDEIEEEVEEQTGMEIGKDVEEELQESGQQGTESSRREEAPADDPFVWEEAVDPDAE